MVTQTRSNIAGVELPDDAQRLIAQALAGNAADKPRWRRAMLSRRRGRLTLAIDGQSIFRDVTARGAGGRTPIGLRHENGAIEFANIFVKE